MPDIDKIINHLDDMRLFADTRVHQIVSPENWGVYSDLCDFIDLITAEVHAVLKEQEAVKPTWSRGNPFCGACGLRIRGGKFCSECGRQIAWEGR